MSRLTVAFVVAALARQPVGFGFQLVADTVAAKTMTTAAAVVAAAITNGSLPCPLVPFSLLGTSRLVYLAQ